MSLFLRTVQLSCKCNTTVNRRNIDSTQAWAYQATQKSDARTETINQVCLLHIFLYIPRFPRLVCCINLTKADPVQKRWA